MRKHDLIDGSFQPGFFGNLLDMEGTICYNNNK